MGNGNIKEEKIDFELNVFNGELLRERKIDGVWYVDFFMYIY